MRLHFTVRYIIGHVHISGAQLQLLLYSTTATALLHAL